MERRLSRFGDPFDAVDPELTRGIERPILAFGYALPPGLACLQGTRR